MNCDVSLAHASVTLLPNVDTTCILNDVVVPCNEPLYPSAGVLSISLAACVTPNGRGFCSIDSSASQGWWAETMTSAFVPCLHIMTLPSHAS